MKKLLCTCMMLCLLCGTAFADVLWEPISSFYTKHWQECELHQRTYWVNSPEGYTTVWTEPGGAAIANLPNGTLLHVYYRYQGKEGDWGAGEYTLDALRENALTLNEEALPEHGWPEIWVPMEELTLKYDHQSFLEEYADEVREETLTVDLSGLRYCTYEYPGGAFKYQPDEGREELEVSLSPLYKDAEGREWGHCVYLYGDRNIWFCISDLENPDLPAEDRMPELYPAAENGAEAELPEPGHSVPLWLIGGVVVLCGATGVLIFRMRKKK